MFLGQLKNGIFFWSFSKDGIGWKNSPFYLATGQSKCLVMIRRDGILSTLSQSCRLLAKRVKNFSWPWLSLFRVFLKPPTNRPSTIDNLPTNQPTNQPLTNIPPNKCTDLHSTDHPQVRNLRTRKNLNLYLAYKLRF